MFTYFKIFLVALLCSLILTPLVRRLALRWNIVDHPDDHRKLHRGIIPLAGGLAVFAGVVTALIITYFWSPGWRGRFAADWDSLGALLIASTAICLLGLMDDRWGLRGRQKLVGQILVALILISSGMVIRTLAIFEIPFELGLLAIPFTLFWLVGATNALNLIDGMDGLATSVGIVLSLAISVMAMMTGHPIDALVAMAIAGSLVGFWVYNSAPASIFLGDAGSMMIGLVLGALAIRCSLKGPATIALVAPTALLAVPIMDVTMAIVRRLLMGRSIYSADRGHLHHRLLSRGYNQRMTVLIISLLCMITAAAALYAEFIRNDLLAIIAVAAIIAMLAVTRLFGYEELQLIKSRTKQFFHSFAPHHRRHPEHGQLESHLQGNAQWRELWRMLTEFAERHDLISIRLNIHLPAYGEEYSATWTRAGFRDDDPHWNCELPLVAHGLPIGRLRISGICLEQDICMTIADLIYDLKPFEVQMLDLLEQELPQLRQRHLQPHAS